MTCALMKRLARRTMRFCGAEPLFAGFMRADESQVRDWARVENVKEEYHDFLPRE